MKNKQPRTDRPTGIIRTLIASKSNELGHTKMLESLELLEQDKIPAIYISLAQVPKQDVLHIYLLVKGEIIARLNIAGFEDGTSQKCWDDKVRKPKCWAVCTAPLSRPTEPIKRRGFQGIRYTEDLW
jgi:hypothetical protein